MRTCLDQSASGVRAIVQSRNEISDAIMRVGLAVISTPQPQSERDLWTTSTYHPIEFRSRQRPILSPDGRTQSSNQRQVFEQYVSNRIARARAGLAKL